MPNPKNIRVLVVDDQKSMRGLTRYSLEQLGFVTISEAADGKAGLESAINDPVDLIISDYNMPEMDGLQFLRAVRSDPNMRKTPFIMVTGRGDKELVTKAAQAGVNNYVVKPFTVEILRKKIEAVVGRLEV
ncbi:MAG: response regulator [Alphaproteobacteria bacterium]|nr:response regulator [Alphaproteobacteria bacterium]